MAMQILDERALPHGPTVRIRRTTDPGKSPVVAVLEIDRRAGTDVVADRRPGNPRPDAAA